MNSITVVGRLAAEPEPPSTGLETDRRLRSRVVIDR